MSDDIHERVKHYLVKAEDLAPNKTLADFVKTKPQWIHLLRLDFNNFTLTKHHKDQMLQQYYSVNPGDHSSNKKKGGYVLL